VAIGKIIDRAALTIDAAGLVVAPGFLDVHTHYDVQAFWDPTLSPSPLHGVTSVLGGNCGYSVAPLTDDAAEYLMPMLARVEGMPLQSLEEGVPWDWRTTAEYLDRLEHRLAVNAGFMVGHSALRRVVMGEAATERASTGAELDSMRNLLREGLAAGGLGFSSSVAENHSDGEGRPVPSRHATYEEIIALSAVCREYPGTSLELLPQAGVDAFLAERLDLMSRMSVAAQRPLNWNLLQVRAGNEAQAEGRLVAGDHAKARGGRIVALMMPLPVASRQNICGRVFDTIDGWPEMLAALSDREKLVVFSDPVQRARLGELARDARKVAAPWVTNWAGYEILATFAPENAHYQGRNVADIAVEEDKEPFDAFLDIVCRDELRTAFSRPQPPDTRPDWEARATRMRDPRVLVGASDAGAHLDGLATFNYTTRVLAEGVRTHNVLTTEEAVHHLTQAPATLFGLHDRGILAVGMAGDVVIFDESTVGSGPTETRADLPGGASRLYAEATGVTHVIVNGRIIVDQGVLTGDQPGTVLRSGRDTVTPSLD
jgi:N-acyl-D-aspartate/D-glutamate deacylase